MHTHARTHTHTPYAHTRTHAHPHTHIRTHVAHKHTNTHTHTHIHIHTYTHRALNTLDAAGPAATRGADVLEFFLGHHDRASTPAILAGDMSCEPGGGVVQALATNWDAHTEGHEDMGTTARGAKTAYLMDRRLGVWCTRASHPQTVLGVAECREVAGGDAGEVWSHLPLQATWFYKAGTI